MAIYFGGIDPIKLMEGTLNLLIEKGVITSEEARKIVDNAKQKQK